MVKRSLTAIALMCLALWPLSALSADPAATVRLSFAEEVRLVDLVDYVSERTATPFVYDGSLTGEVTIRSPLEVKVNDLIPILRSILEFKGYQMMEAEGWYKIRRGDRPEALLREGPQEVFLSGVLPEELRPDAVYTIVFQLDHVKAEEFAGTLRSATGMSPVPTPDASSLILTEYGSRIALAAQMAEALDRPQPTLAAGFYTFRHVQAAKVEELALGVLRARHVPDLTTGGSQVSGPALYTDAAANRVVLLLPPEKLAPAVETLELLDTPGNAEPRSYRVERLSARQAVTYLRSMVGARMPGLPELVAEPLGPNRLVVVASPPVHQAVEEALALLKERADLRLEFLPVQHIQASRVLTLAEAVLNLSEEQDGRGEMLMVAPQENTLIARLTERHHQQLHELLDRFDTPREAVRATRLQFYQIRNTDAAQLAGRLRSVLGVAGGEEREEVEDAVERMLQSERHAGFRRIGEPTEETSNRPYREQPPQPASAVEESEPADGVVQPQAVRIVADKNTNSIIVQAPIEYHETIGRLVEYLDRRRPQVLLEATIASVSVGSDLAVAVELLHHEDTRTIDALVFSAFGLSEVDLSSGTRELVPATGFNASVVDPDGTSAIIRALRSDSRSRVLAEPKILVNDNGTGRFESIREEPFTSVNVGDTVSTTTFGGYAEAGLTIEVTPQISEGDFVRLEYAVTSRDFGETSGQPGVPPARTSDSIASSVTLPDGHTVVMGGLTRERDSLAEEKVPILGSIPVLGTLFRSRTSGRGRSRLFIFLRPTVLRDDDFGDLREATGADLFDAPKRATGPEAIYPPMQPRVMR